MAHPDDPLRPGELRLSPDPGSRNDATLAFIGRIRSAWSPEDCPKNIAEARARATPARLEIDAPYRPALTGLAPGDALILLYWTGRARRDLAIQSPRHKPAPTGTFALRSPARPNPIALGVVRLLSVDQATGLLGIDATDAFDGTPLLDIKPFLPGVDIPPG
ncbi:tRNA (N6-threonylcarbamoyladenosine(37)-N6)-methyltransferase TrmO [Tabrizicola sp. TH137]|uniref:SAM-dependent methyltransferase n=1 Tax=Tabrizicola sp. TH137 TaxID=2067452 RepID=UPI000C7A9CB9|nr:TrmO family methyltransferase [Tabrizicola sp. TH137]PLL13026.1 tRNA (N6-threonylcarbamoyladenosine(37)-N6)-methyltransferase TrmO [Tabrizicola sp. TH137]